MTEQERTELHRLTQEYRGDFSPNVEDGLRRLRQRVALPVSTPRRPLPRFRFAAAAALALLTFSVAMIYFISRDRDQIYTSGGEVLVVELADGSTVTLNQHSELTVPADFGIAQRRVRLEGEAFFDVTHDESRPFLVREEEVELEVLGTRFNLRTEPENGRFEVEVSTGLVQLTAPDRELRIKPHFCGIFTKEHGLVEMPAPNLNRSSWLTREIRFDNSPLSEVLQILSRTYNVSFRTNEGIAKECPTAIDGNYKGLSLETVLSEMAKLIDESATFSVDKEGVTLSGNWCGR